MKASRIVVLVSTVLVLGACGTAPLGPPDAADTADTTANLADITCPETYEEEGQVDGIDLTPPDWLPAGFPLPRGMSIHFIQDQVAEGDPIRVLTGFIPDGDAAVVVAEFDRNLRAAGYEILFAADEVIPEDTEAVVALSASLEILVLLDVTETELPVRVSDGTCPWRPGLLVGIKVRPVDPDQARRQYSGTSLTRGKARAVIGGREFLAKGECLVQGHTHTFTSTSGAGIVLALNESGRGTFVQASVNTVDVVFNLDHGTWGTDPTFTVSASGFSVEGVFINGGGGKRLVEGRVEVTCP
jgi:hypothetical protein